jgi:hypothetical protein
MTGFSIYQAIGFSSVFVNGIEISRGFDKSILNSLLMFYYHVALNTNLKETQGTQKLSNFVPSFFLCGLRYSPNLKKKSDAIPSVKTFLCRF